MTAKARQTKNISLKPPLKWAGGKRWLVPYLASFWQEYRSRRLIEPFCGGLAVTLGLMPATALLNDANVHLINFFQTLKKGLTVALTMENDKEHYYRCRESFNHLLAAGKQQTREAAELFYYLNRTGYNGLCRFNRKGFFNVPFGRHKKINYTSDFLPYKDLFSNWDFTSMDFEKLILNDDDFVYADPPYDVEFTSYESKGFTWDDQVRLGHWLAKHPGPVVLSNQATERITRLYKELGFNLHFLEAPRMISCNGNRTPAREVLAIRNLRSA